MLVLTLIEGLILLVAWPFIKDPLPWCIVAGGVWVLNPAWLMLMHPELMRSTPAPTSDFMFERMKYQKLSNIEHKINNDYNRNF